jgi:hypothetical protein
MNMKTAHSLAAALSMLLSAVPALAHHSAAGVDETQTLSADATLKQFSWSAPHAQIVVTYRDANGKDIDVSVTSFAPGILIRQGFSPKDFRRGDKIKLYWHPNRNGSAGGILSKIVAADGRVLSGEGPGGAGPPPGGAGPPPGGAGPPPSGAGPPPSGAGPPPGGGGPPRY